MTETVAHNRPSTLPTDAQARKTFPIATGVLDYFPDALLEVARVSWEGNQQHNPGEPLHWAREKSTDQENTALRHFMQRGALDTDGRRHLAKAAWRILAMLQLEMEEAQQAQQEPSAASILGDLNDILMVQQEGEMVDLGDRKLRVLIVTQVVR